MTSRLMAACLVALLAASLAGGCRTPAPSLGAAVQPPAILAPSVAAPGRSLVAASAEPVVNCNSFRANEGITVTARDASGGAKEGVLRVLVDNPGADLWVIGAWNQWGNARSERDRLHAVAGTPYFEARLALAHGMEYRLLLGGISVVDPAAGAFTPAAAAAPEAANAVFWDRERPGAFKPRAAPVAWRGKPLIIAEADLFGLAAKWPYRGGIGPVRAADTYRFVSESGIVAELRSAGYDALQLLPVNASLGGAAWRDRFQVYGAFAPDPRYGTPDDFARMIDAFNRSGIGVLLDAVVGGYPVAAAGGGVKTAGIGLGLWRSANGAALFGEQPGPAGTVLYDAASPHVRRFLADGVLTMVCGYGMSGVRLRGSPTVSETGDASWLTALAAEVRAYRPGAPVIHAAPAAEPGGRGVPGLLGSADLDGFFRDNLGRPAASVDMSRLKRALRGDTVRAELSYLTSHDEAVPPAVDAAGAYLATRLSGGDWYYVEKKTMAFASVALLSGAAYLDMPQERLLQLGSLDDSPWVDWALKARSSQAGVYAYLAALSTLVRERPEFNADPARPPAAAEIDAGAGRRIVVLGRPGAGGKGVVAIVNLSHVGQANYRISVAAPGPYRVLLNSDAEAFGGSGELERRLALGVTVADTGEAGGSTLALPYLAPYATVLLERQ